LHELEPHNRGALLVATVFDVPDHLSHAVADLLCIATRQRRAAGW
jgi:hypothetical protein